MPDFKKMTVERLRELARKMLGPGHSRLKTKAELVRALEEAGASAKAVGARARPAASRAAAATGKAVRAARDVGEAAREGARALARAGKAAAGAATEGARAGSRSARARKGGKVSKVAAAAAGAVAGVAAVASAARRARSGRPPAGLPDPEGYFVARVRGEDAVREAPHAMGEAGSDTPYPEYPEGVGEPLYDEGLGELPWSYGDDAFVALARDPKTMFLYWDLSHHTTARAFEGLEGGRAQLWVFARAGGGWDRLRTVEFALESRGFYVHDLEPGRTYRAEIHAVDARGTDRLVAATRNEATLPPVGPSPIVDDRFIRIPWDMPLGRLLGPGHPGGPFSDEARALLARLSDWTRFGASWGGGSAGGMGGRPSSAVSSPSSPFGRPGPGDEG